MHRSRVSISPSTRWSVRRVRSIRAFAALIALLCGNARPQEVDTVLFRGQAPQHTVLDEIQDPRERRSLEALVGDLEPQARKELAEAFLKAFPASASRATVLDIAAKAAIDTGDLEAGIAHAKSSLRMLPENPLLLVALADAQASRERLGDAAASADLALYYLDRFEKPSRFGAAEWKVREAELRASCHAIRGRAALVRSFGAAGSQRDADLRTAVTELRGARSYSSSHASAAYLLGVAYALSNEESAAKSNLADAYELGGPMQARAARELRRILRSEGISDQESLERYVASIDRLPIPSQQRSDPPPQAPANYAGSIACRACHQAVYDSWKQTGMAKMFQHYEPANVLGDFSERIEFKAENGLGALRLGLDQGRHYMEVADAGGAWSRFDIHYTIGSKWQQSWAHPARPSSESLMATLRSRPTLPVG